MRREILFTLFGFLGGFVLAATVFWQPSQTSPPAEQPKSVVIETGTHLGNNGSTGLVDRGRRPVVVSASEAEPAVEAPAQGSTPKSPAELMHETLAALSALKPEQRQAAASELIAKLRAQGPAGLQAVRDFLKAGRDVKFQGGYGMTNGKLTMAPSLRIALLNSLADWPAAGAVDAMRDVLRSTPRMFEAGMAIRQLEAKSPGTYRAEAIQALQQLADSPPEAGGIGDGGNTIFEALRNYKAPELIPLAEKLVEKNAWAASQFLNAISDLPPNLRQPAIERLFARPETVKQLAANPYGLQALSYTDPLVSRNVAQIFASNMDKKGRENFLMSIGTSQAVYGGMSVGGGGGGWSTGTVPVADDASQKMQLKARLAFLDQIAPQCATPVLQERLQDAREALQKAIARPPAQLKPGGAAVNASSSVFQIVGDSINVDAGAGRIQVIQQTGK